MYMYMMFSLMPMILIFLLIMINYFFSFKSYNDREKPTPFECGFNPITNSNFPFSIHFFLVGLIFLIFDMEILLILPIIISLKTNNMIFWFNFSFITIILILFTTLYEWKKQSMMWLT